MTKTSAVTKQHPNTLLALSVGAAAVAAVAICGANAGAILGSAIAATGLWKLRF